MAQQLIKEKDSTQLFQRTAEALFIELEGLSNREHLVLGLCGGRSVVGLLSTLRGWVVSGSISPKRSELLKRLQFFMVDERLVPFTDEQSNYGMLKKNLLDDLVERGVIRSEQLHPFTPRGELSDYGTEAYLQELNRFGGAFSAVVLGVGEDGHVAGLFPDHPCLQRTEPLFLSFFESPKPPQERMTATLSLLRTAEVAVLILTGGAKRDAWAKFQNEGTEIRECPSVFAKELSSLIIATDL